MKYFKYNLEVIMDKSKKILEQRISRLENILRRKNESDDLFAEEQALELLQDAVYSVIDNINPDELSQLAESTNDSRIIAAVDEFVSATLNLSDAVEA
jgi:hypothetical protein